MPRIDVTRVLRSPAFTEKLRCERQVETIHEGRAVYTAQAFDFVGVVTADRGTEMVRLANGTRVSGSILIHTQFRLVDGGAGLAADEVLWLGNRYTVASVNDYSQYGAGFVCASCDLVPLEGTGP